MFHQSSNYLTIDNIWTLFGTLKNFAPLHVEVVKAKRKFISMHCFPQHQFQDG